MPLITSIALWLPGTLRFGRVHVSVLALATALGLGAALVLSQRTARLVSLSPSALWDAGIFSLICGVLVSRLMLAAFNLRQLIAYPVLLLSLPSFTGLDFGLTAIAVSLYLRRQSLPLRSVLDAWAPPLCLLAAALQLGHFIEGTAAGLPSTMPWAFHTPGDTVLGPVHPVQLYAAGVFTGLAFVLIRQLRFAVAPGRIAAVAFTAGGTASFLLDMLRQPQDSFDTSWLDPSQFIALASVVFGTVLWQISPARRLSGQGRPLAGFATIVQEPR